MADEQKKNEAADETVDEAPEQETAAEETQVPAAAPPESVAAGGPPAPANPARREPAPSPAAPPEPKRKKKRLPRALRRQRTKTRPEKPSERKPIVRLPKPEGERGRRQERQGTVVSAAMDKTIVVKGDTIKAHRRYQKVVRRSTKFHAHDERNEAKVGDVVRIVETRPLSKTKNWRLVQIVEAAK